MYFILDPFASLETHLLLRRPICFFGDPFASSKTIYISSENFSFIIRDNQANWKPPMFNCKPPIFHRRPSIFDIYLSRDPVEDLVDERDQGIVLQEEQLPTGVQVRKQNKKGILPTSGLKFHKRLARDFKLPLQRYPLHLCFRIVTHTVVFITPWNRKTTFKQSVVYYLLLKFKQSINLLSKKRSMYFVKL